MRQIRILVTGWRSWPEEDKYVVWGVLNKYQISQPADRTFVVIHGQCPFGGVDLYAEQWAITRGHLFEPHPARVVKGKILGPERNAKMVAIGADVCLAFPGPDSRGTVDCMKRARAAGIPVIETPW